MIAFSVPDASREAMAESIARLRTLGRVFEVSPDGAGQPDYLPAAVKGHPALDPLAQTVEGVPITAAQARSARR